MLNNPDTTRRSSGERRARNAAPPPGWRAGLLMPVVCAVLALAWSAPASAGKPANVTEEEMKLLPRYCPDTQGFKYGDASSRTSPNAGRWVSMMGNGFWHVHHHCWALISVLRSEKAGISYQQKTALRESALDNFRYVVENVSPDFILLPEVYTWVGRMEALLKRPQNAYEAFSKAQQLKPDYWPAYSHWAEYLLSAGKRAEALKVTTAGLQHSPNSKVLLELYRVLGGRPSDQSKTPRAPANGEDKPVQPAASLGGPAESPAVADEQKAARP